MVALCPSKAITVAVLPARTGEIMLTSNSGELMVTFETRHEPPERSTVTASPPLATYVSTLPDWDMDSEKSGLGSSHKTVNFPSWSIEASWLVRNVLS